MAVSTCTRFVTKADQPRLLITGASSGIGLEASRRLVFDGYHLTLLCRTPQRCRETSDRLEDDGADPDNLEVLPMDLADLENVERGCQQLLERGHHFDALILNAGLQSVGVREPLFNPQGIEATFAVNQLAHQLILMRLLPLLLKSSQPRLVITASDVHNPSSGGGRVGRPAGLETMDGLNFGAGFLMVDGHSAYDADKAYKDSKLCNVLMGREVARQLQEQGHPIPVIAWSPGLVIPRGEGGFFRTSRQNNPLGLALFALVARDLLRLTESVQTAGALLASLVNDDAYNKPGFAYYSNRLLGPGRHRFGSSPTSEEGADASKASELWLRCEELISAGIQGDPPIAMVEPST